jgi:hypothetical protein
MNTEFSIIFTPPLVITADGDWNKEPFSGHFPYHYQRKMIIGGQTFKDKERAKKLKSGEMVDFSFSVPKGLLDKACDEIAKEIILKGGVSGELFLVGGAKGDSVIALSGIDAQQLAVQIREIIE